MSTSTIVHVNKAFSPEIGGVEKVCEQYVNVSKSIFAKIKVITISNEIGFGTDEEFIKEVIINKSKYQFKIFGHRFSIGFLFNLLMHCRGHFLIHAHDPFPLATLIFYFFRPKNLIITYHSDIVKQKTVKWLVDYFRLSVLKNASFVTVTSQSLAKNSDIIRHLPKNKVKVVTLYLDDSAKYKGPPKKEISIPQNIAKIIDGPPFILMIGRLNYYKGLDLLFDALTEILSHKKEIYSRIVIVGENADEEAQDLSAKITNLDCDVIRLEYFLPEELKIILLQNCLFLLFPSTLKSEAFGIVQLEALASEKGILNLNLPTGVPDIGLHGKTAKTLCGNVVNELVAVLLNQNHDYEKLIELGKNGPSFIKENFDRKTQEKKIADLYRQFVI